MIELAKMAKRNSPRISLLGQVYPYKGGCSHYNSSIANCLSRYVPVKVISFIRPFISVRLPGDKKDFLSENFLHPPVIFSFDILDPNSWTKTGEIISDFNPDVLLLEWNCWQYSIPYAILLNKIRKRCRCEIWLLCHEPLPRIGFMQRAISIPFTKLLFRRVDSVIVHSDQDYKIVKELAPNSNVKKLFHPVFDILYQDIRKSSAKKALNLKGNVILFFGYVYDSKGLRYLIDSLPRVLKRVDVTLLVVGEFAESKQKYHDQIRRLNLEKHVNVIARYVSDQELANYFSAADIVVLPYLSANQSGVANTAYAFNKPVIATKVGGLPEIVQDGRTGYLVEAGNSEKLADSIIRFYTKDKNKDFSKAINRIKKKFSFDKFCKKIIACIRNSL